MTVPAPLRFTATQLLTVARSMRGATETPPGSNRTIFGAAYGLDGVPWCAIFVWWCFHQLGVELRTLLTSKLEWTPTFAQACAAAGWRSIPLGQQEPGDVVFFRFGTMIDHVGLCTAAGDAATIQTIDGNTGDASQNNGGMVCDRTRGTSVVAAIYRPPFALTVAPIVRPSLSRVLRYRRFWINQRGADVAQVQRLVGAVPDGVFGPQTAQAVAVWEHKVRIAQDGEFGPQCCRAAGWNWSGK